MIEIPECLRCKNCKKGMKCEAYPDGIPPKVMYQKKEEHEVCNNGISFVKSPSKQSAFSKKYK